MVRKAALLLLVCCGLAHAGDTEDDCADLRQLALAAALDDAQAQFNLAVRFYTGECVAQDRAKAAYLWQRAADAGIVTALNNLGYLSYYGLGVEEDRAQGVRLWRQAAERGEVEAQIHLASAHLDGKHLPVDPVEAFAWASTALEQAGSEDHLEMAADAKGRAEARLDGEGLARAQQRAREYETRYSGDAVQRAPR